MSDHGDERAGDLPQQVEGGVPPNAVLPPRTVPPPRGGLGRGHSGRGRGRV